MMKYLEVRNILLLMYARNPPQMLLLCGIHGKTTMVSVPSYNSFVDVFVSHQYTIHGPLA